MRWDKDGQRVFFMAHFLLWRWAIKVSTRSSLPWVRQVLNMSCMFFLCGDIYIYTVWSKLYTVTIGLYSYVIVIYIHTHTILLLLYIYIYTHTHTFPKSNRIACCCWTATATWPRAAICASWAVACLGSAWWPDAVWWAGGVGGNSPGWES